MQDNFVLDHIIRKPKVSVENAPALILLHGYGSDENDLFSFAEEMPEELFIISAKAPYPMQPYGNAWYAIHFDNENGKFSDDIQAIKSRDMIATFIDQVIENYPVDASKINLLGFSQGSILSYAVALTYPEKIDNVIALSGYINKEIFGQDYLKNDLSQLSFYCSHGSADQVIPVDWARRTKPFLENLGVDFTYSEFPVGHGVAPQNFFELKKWLQKRL
ncbi:alpha/beta fold hydrolase [uncultured Christiangramia sp.]|uniref:alpha/beta hydrolase n=1 Tax=uncultured Christiangramia sp. TaxID=503836 RepID=UPI0025E208FB|nr:alpha/beta fold hydrolase [uncultured Christiangramia sp.]|tara:strand:+ start:1316 stop:1972 length:657 start_codon:yes stop_codon:yes gene_type:complete